MYHELIQGMGIEHRDYQERVVLSAIEHIQNDVPTMMIESPTGSGKSIMGLLIAKYVEKRFGCSTGWVSMRRNILAQIVNFNKQIGVNRLHPISMFDSDPPKVDILIVDEGHHDSTNSCMHLHNFIRPKIIIGLTATPFRTDRMRLCFQKIIKDAGIPTLVEQNYLAQFKHYTIPRWSTTDVVNTYLRHPEHWGKTVMFFYRIAECEHAAGILREHGVSCDVVTGYTDRERQLARFEDGETDVILNVYVLSEGFDCPTLRTLFIRPASKLPTIQMGGRCLRKHPDKPWANIVQSEHTLFPFTRLTRAIQRLKWMNDEWRTVETNNEVIKRVSMTALMTMAGTCVQLPEIIVKARRRRSYYLRQLYNG